MATTAAPERRGLIPLDERFHIPHGLAKSLKRKPFEIRWDTAFREVMLGCAARETRLQHCNVRWVSECRKAIADLESQRQAIRQRLLHEVIPKVERNGDGRLRVR